MPWRCRTSSAAGAQSGSIKVDPGPGRVVVTWPTARARHGGIDEIPLPGVPGRLWLCGKHAVGPDHEVALAEVEATTIVCLTQVAELDERYPEYLTWLRSEPEHAIW